MSFHGRAPQRIQQAMQAMVPAPRPQLPASPMFGPNPGMMHPDYRKYQPGYHPTEGQKMLNLRDAQQVPGYRPVDPWENSYQVPYQEINRETAPSTAGNSPVNGSQRALQPGAIDVASLPPAGSNFSPQEMANWLISQKRETQAAVIGGGLVGVGALGMGVNALQGDSNGALGLAPVAQAGLLGGAGAILGYGGVNMYQGQNKPTTALGFDQPASAARDARRGRHRTYGAMAGTAAGALLGLTSQLNDRLQTEQY